ncbi:MAG TPA: hypothetical protein IAA58_11820 [Candidatus Gallacutalibacter stercoravium]|nr:hypothetical protein [Candidatus Gallacutalibacter stercoravium]
MAGRIYRKKSKGVKILAATLALALLAPLAVSQPAVHAQAATYSVQEQIVMEALDIDSLAGVDYDLVQVEESNQPDTSGVSPFSAQPEEDKQNLAVRINKSFPDGTLRSEFYVPYTETEEGLENTFALAANGDVVSGSGSDSDPYSNFVMTAVGYAGRFIQEPAFVSFYCYKPYYTHASWRRVSGSGTVTSITPILDVYAVKHFYDNSNQIMGAALPGNMGSSAYPEITHERQENTYLSPVSNTYYTSGNMYTASSGYVFACEELYPVHYIATGFNVNYRDSNGNTGHHGTAFPFVRK